MGISEIITLVDREIALLKQARALLVGDRAASGKRPVGRPRKNAIVGDVVKVGKKKRNLTPEGRKRIAEAVKRRWAAQKKTAAK